VFSYFQIKGSRLPAQKFLVSLFSKSDDLGDFLKVAVQYGVLGVCTTICVANRKADAQVLATKSEAISSTKGHYRPANCRFKSGAIVPF